MIRFKELSLEGSRWLGAIAEKAVARGENRI
jgi:hypothetical protein